MGARRALIRGRLGGQGQNCGGQEQIALTLRVAAGAAPAMVFCETRAIVSVFWGKGRVEKIGKGEEEGARRGGGAISFRAGVGAPSSPPPLPPPPVRAPCSSWSPCSFV
jgi:hypothetical protein